MSDQSTRIAENREPKTQATGQFITRSPAKVLGCLKNGEITIITNPGHGIVTVEPVPVDWIPKDLRMPNCEFDILVRFPGAERVGVIRKNEDYP